jgi:Tfp pilus assembly protein FimV
LPARRRPEPHWGARLLAPAAFLLAATVAILLIRAGLADDDPVPLPARPAATTRRPARPAPPPTTTKKQAAPRRRTYTIQEGDTLDQVAFDHDTTVAQLLRLNPTIDPTNLQVGQKILVP